MCGRYYIETGEDVIEIRSIIKEVQDKLYGTPELAQLKTGEIYPTNLVPIISSDGTVAMRWGYPKWDGKSVIINANAETAAEKNMFRKSLMERRCVVPTSGFYEWLHEGGKSKEKHLFTLPDERYFIWLLSIIYSMVRTCQDLRY